MATEWTTIANETVIQIDHNAYVIKIKNFVGKENPVMEAIQQHGTVVLNKIIGREMSRDRTVGYCLLFSGVPTIHHYTRYCSLSYSEPTDIRFRQMRVLYDDQYIRFTRFGMGAFDYLWQVRHRLPQHHEIPAADHAAYQHYERTWKKGI